LNKSNTGFSISLQPKTGQKGSFPDEILSKNVTIPVPFAILRKRCGHLNYFGDVEYFIGFLHTDNFYG
jgi:hypothetical protein